VNIVLELKKQKSIMAENLPLVLTVQEVARYLRIGKSLAYELTKRKDFPALRIGRTVRVHRDAFLLWLEENLKK